MKKLIERIASFGRRRNLEINRGHFVVYTIEGERFMIPLNYLKKRIFGELLRLSEEEFGLSNEGPIVLPCDASLMNYAIDLIRRKVSEEAEQKLLDLLIASNHKCCGLPSFELCQDVLVC
ncbi:hypothetical protein LUZ60_007081 [Juncus effusus]|nr:hypothetical protein LUZ60_007081 [Juncus effusus]